MLNVVSTGGNKTDSLKKGNNMFVNLKLFCLLWNNMVWHCYQQLVIMVHHGIIHKEIKNLAAKGETLLQYI